MLRSAAHGGVNSRTRSGADAVVDYTPEDVTRSDRRFDLAIDIAGTRPFRQLRRVPLRARPPWSSAAERANRLLGLIGHVAGCKIGARDLVETGKLTSAVDDVFPFERVATHWTWADTHAARSSSRFPTLDGRPRGRAR